MPGEGPLVGYKKLQDWEQPVVTGWQWDVLGEEEESVCLSVHPSGECCLLCCLGPASALGHGFCGFVKHFGAGTLVLDCGWKDSGLGLKGEKCGQKDFSVAEPEGVGRGVG